MPRPGPRTTYKYSDQFGATAVRLSELRGVSVQEVELIRQLLAGHKVLLLGALRIGCRVPSIGSTKQPSR